MGFQFQSLGFLSVEKGLALAVRAIRVLCGLNLAVGGHQGRGPGHSYTLRGLWSWRGKLGCRTEMWTGIQIERDRKGVGL